VEYSVRAVQEEDAASIVELLNPIIRAETHTVMDEPVSVDDQIDFIRGLPERGVYLVAARDDDGAALGIQDVVPFSLAERAFAHVGVISTFVSLSHQGVGVGSRLTEATIQMAKENGFLKLVATIRADNPQALSFYEGQGFKIVGLARKHALVRGKLVDEILTERFLD